MNISQANFEDTSLKAVVAWLVQIILLPLILQARDSGYTNKNTKIAIHKRRQIETSVT